MTRSEFGLRDKKGRLPFHSWFVGFVPKNPYKADFTKPDSQLVFLAFALHTVAMVKRGMSLNRCPLNNLFEALTFAGWALVLCCLVVGALPRLRFLAATGGGPPELDAQVESPRVWRGERLPGALPRATTRTTARAARNCARSRWVISRSCSAIGTSGDGTG